MNSSISSINSVQATDSHHPSHAATVHAELRYFPQPGAWWLTDLRELYAFRELLWMFFVRDLKIRYRQVFIGLAWVLLQPTLGMAIFLAIFWLMEAKPTSDTANYASDATIIYTGMLLWQFVAASLRDATGSLVNYRHVITKIAFPRLLLPLASVLCAGFDLLIASALLPIVVWIGGDALRWSTVWLLPVVVILLAVFVVGCVAWLSSLNAFYRDIGYALPFLLQLGMFASPVIYDLSRIQTSSQIPVVVQLLYESNPVCSAIGWARHVAFGGPAPSLAATAIAVVFSIVCFVTGLAWFRSQNERLADRI